MSDPIKREKISVGRWGETTIAPGETANIYLNVGESYSGRILRIPIQVRRAAEDGPTLFVTAALHGDEINGTGVIRDLIQSGQLDGLLRGNLILVPVLNLLGFERHSRYLPDRRDLNRCFPGSDTGSLAARMARHIFDAIVLRSDFGIDLHTAALRRTNYPNVRGDLSDPQIKKLAHAFGAEVIMDGPGPEGSFRAEACKAGCPTIVMEGGEVWKFEPTILESASNGVINVLRELNMLDGEATVPEHQFIIEKSKWIRAERGGLMQFHVAPGDVVTKNQVIATNTSLLGKAKSNLSSPYDGVIIGMSTLPAISPGDPICHIGKFFRGTLPADISETRSADEGIEERLIGDLASNVHVTAPPKQ
jgi:predicted deacylase